MDSEPQVNTEKTVSNFCSHEENEVMEQFLRLQAEFANYRKRIEREKEIDASLANLRLVRELVIFSNEFDKALKNISKEVKPKDGEGMNLLGKKLSAILSSEGVEIIAPEKGTQFNRNEQEVVGTIDAEVEGKIIEVVKPGFNIRGKLIEPSLVIVTKQSK